MKWEYFKAYNEDLSEERLNNLGLCRWELVTVVNNTYIFKREKK